MNTEMVSMPIFRSINTPFLQDLDSLLCLWHKVDTHTSLRPNVKKQSKCFLKGGIFISKCWQGLNQKQIKVWMY